MILDDLQRVIIKCFVFENKLPWSRSICAQVPKGGAIRGLSSRLCFELSKQISHNIKGASRWFLVIGDGVLTNVFLLLKHKPLALRQVFAFSLASKDDPRVLGIHAIFKEAIHFFSPPLCPKPPKQSFPLNWQEYHPYGRLQRYFGSCYWNRIGWPRNSKWRWTTYWLPSTIVERIDTCISVKVSIVEINFWHAALWELCNIRKDDPYGEGNRIWDL